jgi:hypothetical protein
MKANLEEAKKLFLCLGETNDLTALEHLSTAEWAVLVTLAVRHGVAPLLYQRLVKEKGAPAIPLNFKQQLRAAYYACLGKNTMLYHELGEVLLQLQQANIPVVVLKGAYLAEEVYGNPALRPMQDIDLLVHMDDLQRNLAVLERMGYHPKWESNLEEEMDSIQHVPTLAKPDHCDVEIHWTLAPSVLQLKFNVDEIWQQALPAVLGGVETLVMVPEHALVYQCMHAAIMHKFSFRLRALYDIAAILQRYRGALDWQRIERTAREWGIVNAVYLNLYLAGFWLGAEAPQEVMARLRPADFTPELGDWAVEKMLSEKIIVNETFASLWGKKPPAKKAGVLLNSLFPPLEELAEKYHIPKNSLRLVYYYPVNVFIHLARYWRLGLRMVNSREDEFAARVKRENLLREWLKSA